MPDTANLDQFVSGLSPTLQLIINGIVLVAAVAAAVFGYFRKARPPAPAAPGELQAQVVGGALADRASMHSLAESNHALAVAIRGLTAVIEKHHASEAAHDAEEGLKKRIDDLVEERLRALESPAPTRRPPRG